MNLKGLKAKINKTEEVVIVISESPNKYNRIPVLFKDGNMSAVCMYNITILEPEKVFNQEENKTYSFIGKKADALLYKENLTIVTEPQIIPADPNYNSGANAIACVITKDEEGKYETLELEQLVIKN